MAKGNQTDLESRRGDVDRMAAQMGLIITVVVTVVGTFFAVISITDIQFRNIPAFFGETTLIKFALGLFFVHWGWGVKTDLDLQAKHYCRDPNRAKLEKASIVGIVTFIIFFIALFAVHRWLIWFQIILLFFIATNFYAWIAIIKQANPMVRESRKVYLAEADYICLEKLELVYSYMTGRWQRYRFSALIVLAILQLLIAIVLWNGAPYLASSHAFLVSVFGQGLLGQVPGIMFLCYVAVSSVWMASMRLRVLARIDVLQDLGAAYRLEPVNGRRWSGPIASIRARLAAWVKPK